MKWETYRTNYMKLSKINGKDDNYCIQQLEYAKTLFDNNLPIIYNQKHLSNLIGYSLEFLYSVSNDSRKFYRSFKINKKNGKKREINEPLPSLKEIQRWILEEILYNINISPFAKAYIKNKSLKENAKFHRNQNKVLTMDLKDFFPSINFKRVLNVFKSIGYRDNVAVMLANLCCFQKKLPQGAPTSPMLSNIIAKDLDDKISKYVIEKKIRYTRYADDLTFSGNFNEKELIKNIKKIVYSEKFLINKEKTRIRKKNQRQVVTGIVVNEKMQLNKKLRHQIRSQVYYIQKYGLVEHIERTKQKRKNYIYYLIGITSYASFINPNDKKLKEYLEILKDELKNSLKV